MIIGIDFDNTIISYDKIFHLAAAEWGYDLANVAESKTAVRDHLRSLGDEQRWIELQGYVYGKRMSDAEPYFGVLPFFREVKRLGVQARIVSHKTRYPFSGPKYDLHAATRHWLAKLGLADSDECGIGEGNIYLELTKEAKAERIASVGCDVFLDDLPEFLAQPGLPRSLRKTLFDPSGENAARWDGERVSSWQEFQKLIFG